MVQHFLGKLTPHLTDVGRNANFPKINIWLKLEILFGMLVSASEITLTNYSDYSDK